MSATVLNSCNLSFYQLQSYLHSWHAATRPKEDVYFGSAPSPSKFPAQTHSTEPGVAHVSANNGCSPLTMDKAKFKDRLLDLVRDCVPFEQSARVTLLMTVRLDNCPDALNVDVSEELARAPPATASATAAAAAAAASRCGGGGGGGGSKRKSQAPQRMVPTGEDSFAPAAAAPAAAAAAAAPANAGDASSSFNPDFSDEDPQPLNLSSRQGSPAVANASTPLKPLSAAFQLNNPDIHFGLVLPQAAAVTKQQQLLDASTASNAAAAAAAAAVVAAAAKLQSSASSTSSGGAGSQKAQPAAQQQQQRPVSVRSRRPGNRSFPCNQCGQVFQSLAGLSKHTFTMHKVYKCTFCGANFTQRSNLQRHSLKHVGFKPFECRCCRKSYYRKDHLVRHIEVTHPGHDPKLSIDTRLSSAECLQYLERKHETRDYTSLSGVVPSAAAAAAAASEGTAGAAAACEDEEEMAMMEGEEGEFEDLAPGEELEDGEDMVLEGEGEDEEIDVGEEHQLEHEQHDQQQLVLMEQPVAE